MLKKTGSDDLVSETCDLCGSHGELIYTGLSDRLFGVSGTWGIRRCPNVGCSLAWLVPKPREAEIPLFYANYYTHWSIERISRGTAQERLGRFLFYRFYEAYAKLSGAKLAQDELEAVGISSVPPGRLLEIGCGNGERLRRFQSLGWVVEGQEVDSLAAEAARQFAGDATIHEGDLRGLDLAANSYDAIVMNHVIEHIPAPIELLRVCRDLLRRGGFLALATPNFDSYGRKTYGAKWRGLEPPRHVKLYNVKSLRRLFGMAGFVAYEIRTDPNRGFSIAVSSEDLRMFDRHEMSGPHALRSLWRGFRFFVEARRQWGIDKESGEECVGIAMT